MAINNDAEAISARAALLKNAVKDGAVSVIVTLKSEAEPAVAVGALAAAKARSTRVAQLHQRILARFPALAQAAQTHLYQYTPHMALRVNAAELQRLAQDPDVLDIRPQLWARPSLAQSVPLIGAPNVWSAPNTGSGQMIAILDSGVDKNHPFLVGKVVSEACYSSTISSLSTSLCPGGAAESTAVNSGLYCSGIEGCRHGTHVAGIAAGKSNSSYTELASLSGVAPGATIVAMQVFSSVYKAGGIDGCDTTQETVPCLHVMTPDLDKALARVYTLATQGNQIAAVNLSLGGGSYASSCDTLSSSTKAQIDLLRGLGISTVVASGNDNSSVGISWPACISSAISVGSTTKQDVISSFSNSSAQLNLLAPGGEIDAVSHLGAASYIYSSTPDFGMTYMVGTSMSAPHVAGGVALLKARKPAATVTEVLSVLSQTGVPVLDNRNGLTRPRIQVDTAANFLVKALTVTKNSSDGNNTQHTISWGNASDTLGLSGYTLTVDGTSYQLGTVTSYGLALTPVGTHTLSVVAKDSRGHISAPSSRTYSYPDTGAPTTPTLQISKVSTTPTDTAYTISWSASDNVGIAGYTLTVDGVDTAFTSTQTSTSRALAANVSHTVKIVARDAAGNTSSKTSTLYYDTVAPTAPVTLTAVKLNPTTSSTQTRISWGASTDAVGVTAYRLLVDGVQKAQGNIRQFDITLTLGSHALSVVALDAAGNVSTAKTLTYVVTDTLLPSTPTGLTAVKASPTTSSISTRITWNAASDDTAIGSYKLLVDGTTISVTGTSHTMNLAVAVNHSISVRSADTAGNLSAASATIPYSVASDTIKPSVPANVTVTKLNPSANDFQHQITWSPSTDDVGVTGYRVVVGIPENAGSTITYNVGLVTSHAVSLVPNTRFTIRVYALDAAGNLASPLTATPYSYGYTGSCLAPYPNLGPDVNYLSVSLTPGSGTLTINARRFTPPGTLPTTFLKFLSYTKGGPGGTEYTSSCNLANLPWVISRPLPPTQGGESGITTYSAKACDSTGHCAETMISNPNY